MVGDARFIGLQMKAPREYLADGYYPRGENKRIMRGVATRPGTRTPLFANLYSAPAGFCGSGTYSNPNGAELGLLAVAGKQIVYGIRDGTVPESIFVETAFASDVEFAQHFDKVLAHQSDPAQPLQYWDGLIPEDGFVAVKAPDPIRSLLSAFSASRTALTAFISRIAHGFPFRMSPTRSPRATSITRSFTTRTLPSSE